MIYVICQKYINQIVLFIYFSAIDIKRALSNLTVCMNAPFNKYNIMEISNTEIYLYINLQCLTVQQL